MSRVAVTGAAGPVGRRLVLRLLDDPAVEAVVAIDQMGLDVADDRVVPHQLQLKGADLDPVFAGVDVVCHLAGSDPLEDRAPDHDLHTTTRVLDAARRAGVGQVIVRTSATVYGAWADNPVPLPETTTPRPNAESTWVRHRLEIEEQVRAFAESSPGVVVAIARPCVTVSEAGPDELGRVLAAARLVGEADDAPPAQFVHADDVAAAIDVLRRARVDGVFNVAPDGALDAQLIRALVGGVPRLKVPEALARRLTTFGWRYQLAPTPPGFVPFVRQPWVVGNDRLRGLGWEPTHTNEEAFVAGHAAAPWAQVSPQRRQELALGVAGVTIAGAVAGAVALVRRRLRSSSD
ncbi:NAD-dependent epimerase/dehydratase family protein [Actinospongicola halichondriae]|uniref:NAD-dependent epimerase/dehydratase family protein n=1 Tax=Actinospongicola halichondriae TaxID=3236844 RepID=UPI003D5B1780